MPFAGINYQAVLVAAIAGFALGAAWYSVLGRLWMAAAKVDQTDLGNSRTIYPVAAVCQLIMALLLAGVMGHLGRVDVAGGLTTAFFLWLGFVATTMTVNHRFQGKGWALTAIDGGHWLAVLLAQGAIIGAFGV
jgi:hypothetical protein